MAGTNAVRAKKALVAGVKALLAAESTTDEVKVTYAYRGHEHEREVVHAGRVVGSQDYPVSSGIGPFPRDENLTIKLHVVLAIPGADQEEVEQRVEDIVNFIGDWIALTADLPGFEPGETFSVGVAAVDIDSDADDDLTMAVGTLDITVGTRIN